MIHQHSRRCFTGSAIVVVEFILKALSPTPSAAQGPTAEELYTALNMQFGG